MDLKMEVVPYLRIFLQVEGKVESEWCGCRWNRMFIYLFCHCMAVNGLKTLVHSLLPICSLVNKRHVAFSTNSGFGSIRFIILVFHLISSSLSSELPQRQI